MPGPADELPVHLFAGPAELEAWLEENHDSAAGAWLKIAKKGAPEPSVTYVEALEVALCFGWIDSQKRGLDGTHFLQRFTPRRPGGRWSKINREKAEALIKVGRMRPAGLAEVEAARADGRWEAAYEGQGSAKVPPDLQRELDATPPRLSSSPRSTAPTATRSSIASTRRRSRRRGSDACASSSACSSAARRSTHSRTHLSPVCGDKCVRSLHSTAWIVSC